MATPIELRLKEMSGNQNTANQSSGFNYGGQKQRPPISFQFGTKKSAPPPAAPAVQSPPTSKFSPAAAPQQAANTAVQPQAVFSAPQGQQTATGQQINFGQQTPLGEQTPLGQEEEEREAPNKFSQLYKSRGLKDTQRIRTADSLQRQKEKRYDFMNHVRRITDLFGNDEEEMEEADGDEHQLEYLQEKKNKKEERKKELWRFRNQLMHSEWLLEKPDDFEENWIMIPIPQGKRNMVIASGGHTTTYAKNGMQVNVFNSHLPGGGRHKHKWNQETAILDCVFNETTKTYYILDMMCWRQTPMYDTETQFRFYWMHEKFLEVPEVATIGKNNPFRFEPLPNFRCQDVNITNVLSCEMSVPMDGLLFYHKMTHYTFGFTPLVLWLRPFMIPEALGVMVHQKYIDRATPDYKGFENHKKQCIANLEAREETEKQKKMKKSERRDARRDAKVAAGVVPIGRTFVKAQAQESMET